MNIKYFLKAVFNLKIGNSFFILLFIASTNISVYAQDDTTKSKVPKDTAKLYKPLINHGSLFLLPFNFDRRINKKDLLWMEYSGLFDVLNQFTASYPLTLGGFAANNQLKILGAGARDISFRFNGRPMSDNPYGTFNMNNYPTEFFENIEILTGSDAVIFSNNSSGALFNAQEINYNTKSPFTKLIFTQTGYSYLSSEGVFSQNVLPNLNFTFGFRKQSNKGEYENQWMDNWNIRSFLRWNPSDNTSISLTEIFTNNGNGLNGGTDPANSSNIFDPIAANTLYPNYNERLFRHDLTLAGSTILSSEIETASAFSMSVFFTNAEYFNQINSQFISGLKDSSDKITVMSKILGASGKYEQNLTRFFTLRIGGDFNFTAVDKSFFNDELNGVNLGVFGHLTARPIRDFELSGGIRLSSQVNRFYNSIGGKAKYTVNDSLSVFADISVSQRSPSPSEGLGLKNETHSLFLLGTDIERKDWNLRSSIYFRNVQSPIITNPLYDSTDFIYNTSSIQGNSITLIGADFKFFSAFSKSIFYHINGNISFSDNNGKGLFASPTVLAGLNTFYKFATGRSEVKVGVDFSINYSKTWLRYFPQTRTYVVIENEQKFFYNGINLFAQARLGTTYIKFMLNNVLGSGFYNTAYYPETGRIFKIMINWAFLD